MKNIIFGILIALCFATVVYAESTMNVIQFNMGTAATGVNWSVPDKTSDLQIQSLQTNWMDITTFQVTGGINWSNSFRIPAGSSYKLNNVWSKSNTISVRGQFDNNTAQIIYSQSN